jgi:hypothetical protein
MTKLYCSEIDENYNNINEREITESVFLVDGYKIADRLLEGVIFHVHFEDNKILSVEVDPKHANYFSQFNQEMFLDRVKKYALRVIEGDEVEVPDYIMKKYNFIEGTAAYIK